MREDNGQNEVGAIPPTLGFLTWTRTNSEQARVHFFTASIVLAASIALVYI